MLELLPARMAAKIALAPSGCWEWLGYRDAGGYGMSKLKGIRSRYVHRIVYTLLVGEVPAGLELDHLCRNRGCANPNHLQAVTHRENILRGMTMPARHAQKKTCPRGHPYDHIERRRDGETFRDCSICNRARSRANRNTRSATEGGDAITDRP